MSGFEWTWPKDCFFSSNFCRSRSETVKKFTEKRVALAELLSSLIVLNEILFPEAVNVTTETTRRAVVITELTNGRTGN